jgi:hypothetical protein
MGWPGSSIRKIKPFTLHHQSVMEGDKEHASTGAPPPPSYEEAAFRMFGLVRFLYTSWQSSTCHSQFVIIAQCHCITASSYPFAARTGNRTYSRIVLKASYSCFIHWDDSC